MNKKYLIPSLSISLVLAANAQSFLIDFGDVEGGTTDGNWNNCIDSALSISDMIDTSGNVSDYDLSVSKDSMHGWSRENDEGAPSPFDVSSAYLDGIYVVSGQTVTLTFSDLDSTLTYDFDFFGSRDAEETRITDYTVYTTTPSEGTTVSLTTSGDDLGGEEVDYNTEDIASVYGITPNESNEIYVDITVSAGSFGYLNAMQLTAIPESGTYALLAGLTALAAIATRRRI
jgi:hypothetical protein